MSLTPRGQGPADPTTDVYSAAKRSAVMRRVKSRDTTPERIVRRALTRLGVGYRLHRKDLPGKPDLVMAGRKLVVFVHGCFWHGHDCPRGARVPKQNQAYWIGKVARNRTRDARTCQALEARGWQVVTIWECDLKDLAGLEAQLRALFGPQRQVIPSGTPSAAGGGAQFPARA